MQLRHGGATHTLVAYGRDRLHREISRSQGALSQETHYDTAGRITHHAAHGAGRPPRRAVPVWLRTSLGR
ncbi:hypothetical protein SMX71_004233 [Cronobacter dublinensis]|nr:hypothetical protein [Cronobacter dublinensis]ELY2909624.1 hypothetical protein [Cronobacter dublinensis]ELY3774497.1 hypothetical protein [Cronobacter dublinensis]